MPLQEQLQRLLGLLLDRPGQIVNRERIREALWDRRHGDHEHGINTAVRKLRKVLAEAEGSDLRLVTSAGQGYRLLLPATRQPQPIHPLPVDAEAFLGMDAVGREAFVTGRFCFRSATPKPCLLPRRGLSWPASAILTLPSSMPAFRAPAAF